MVGKHSLAGPSQVEHSWRATVRTVFQALVGLAAILPFLIPAVGLSATVGVGATILGVAAVITKFMAVPQVNAWLDSYLPWLRAE